LPTIPFLGATPDAVINAECIVEVKCPYGGKNEKIIPGEHFKFLCFERNGNVALKKSSSYYDQIQGQLFLSERNFCYFVVYTFVDLFVQIIEVDKDYCLGSLVPKLAILPTDIRILFTNYDIIAYFLNLASCSEHFISIQHRILATFDINKNNQF
jgi:hypothetical protein